MEKVNIAQKFSLFDDLWSPKVIAELNGQYVKLAKLKGEFVWHHHEVEDELFLVTKGRLLIKFRDRDVWLEEGELVAPDDAEHGQRTGRTHNLRIGENLNTPGA